MRGRCGRAVRRESAAHHRPRLAYAPMPDGSVLGCVEDGHERSFITMLAARRADVVLLVIAANKASWPQTGALQILDLLARAGIVALTKADLADDDMRGLRGLRSRPARQDQAAARRSCLFQGFRRSHRPPLKRHGATFGTSERPRHPRLAIDACSYPARRLVVTGTCFR